MPPLPVIVLLMTMVAPALVVRIASLPNANVPPRMLLVPVIAATPPLVTVSAVQNRPRRPRH